MVDRKRKRKRKRGEETFYLAGEFLVSVFYLPLVCFYAYIIEPQKKADPSHNTPKSDQSSSSSGAGKRKATFFCVVKKVDQEREKQGEKVDKKLGRRQKKKSSKFVDLFACSFAWNDNS